MKKKINNYSIYTPNIRLLKVLKYVVLLNDVGINSNHSLYNEELKLKLKTVLIRPEVDFFDTWEHVSFRTFSLKFLIVEGIYKSLPTARRSRSPEEKNFLK